MRHPPSIFLCPSVNFVSFGKNHLLVVSSSKVTPKFYFFIFLSVFIFLKVAKWEGEEYSGTYFKLISRASLQKFLLLSLAGDPPLYLHRMFNNISSFRGFNRKVLRVLETFPIK